MRDRCAEETEVGPALQEEWGRCRCELSRLIAFAGLLLLAGRLGDLIGGRRMFVSGLAVFTAASLLCGISTGSGTLIAARFLQGIGGAMTSAVVLGMLVALFPEGRDRTRAIAVFSAVGAAGGTLGTFLGGGHAPYGQGPPREGPYGQAPSREPLRAEAPHGEPPYGEPPYGEPPYGGATRRSRTEEAAPRGAEPGEVRSKGGQRSAPAALPAPSLTRSSHPNGCTATPHPW